MQLLVHSFIKNLKLVAKDFLKKKKSAVFIFHFFFVFIRSTVENQTLINMFSEITLLHFPKQTQTFTNGINTNGHFHIILCMFLLISLILFNSRDFLSSGIAPSGFLCTFAPRRLQGASLGQQVISLLIGREEGVLQVEEASGHAPLATGVAPQGSADRRVGLVAPGGGGERGEAGSVTAGASSGTLRYYSMKKKSQISVQNK